MTPTPMVVGTPAYMAPEQLRGEGEQAAGAATVDMGDMPEGMAAAVRRAIGFDKDTRPNSPLAFASELKRITKNE